MNYAQFKLNRMKRNGGLGYHIVNLELDNLALDGKTYIADGEAYTCKLVAINGKYLPQVIDIVGTVSRYAFKYDYTTGEIYIPSGEIFNNITIIAKASEINNNIPAVLDVQMMTLDTSDGTNEYTGETFLSLKVYPCRGSSVSITYGGVTKTVTGDISKFTYDCGPKEVKFGTYHGVSDGVTLASGQAIITGAYESYGVGSYKHKGINKKPTSGERFITSFAQLGALRYIPSDFVYEISPTFEFDREISFVKESAFDSSSPVLKFINLPEIRGPIINSTNDFGDAEAALYYPLVSWDEWVSKSRHCYAYYYYYSDGGYYDDSYVERQIGYMNGARLTDITNVQLSNNVEEIAEYAFHEFWNLTNFIIPESVKRIGAGAFMRCIKLSEIILPKEVTEAPNSCFSGCSALTTITLHEGVTKIGDEAFRDCDKLTNINLPNGLTHIGDYAFEGPAQQFIVGLTSLVVPDSVTYIGDGAFLYNRALTSVTLSKNLTTINYRTFERCEALSSIVIPDSVTDIGASAFAYCDDLNNIDIGVSVSSIGSNAFVDCGKKGQCVVRMHCKTPPKLSPTTTTVDGVETITYTSFTAENLKSIIVPQGCASAYKNADGWNTFANYIVEGDV